MGKITKKMTFGELMEKHPKAAGKLAEKGMMCCGCPMAMMESLEDGCKGHGVDADELVEELNKSVEE